MRASKSRSTFLFWNHNLFAGDEELELLATGEGVRGAEKSGLAGEEASRTGIWVHRSAMFLSAGISAELCSSAEMYPCSSSSRSAHS